MFKSETEMKKIQPKEKLETVHIRKRPDAPGIEPVYCGATLVCSVTDAWGYWGPAGDGYDRICKECEKVKRKP